MVRTPLIIGRVMPGDLAVDAWGRTYLIGGNADADRSGVRDVPPPASDSGAVLTTDDIDQRAQAHVEGRVRPC